MVDIYAIAAHDILGGIGLDGSIPWDIKSDLKHFNRLTRDKSQGETAIVYGRLTYLSLPEQFRPLNDRFNIVISTTLPAGLIEENNRPLLVVPSWELAVLACEERNIQSVWACGGTAVYRAAFADPRFKAAFFTEIALNLECDTFLPEHNFETIAHSVVHNDNGYTFCFVTCVPKEKVITSEQTSNFSSLDILKPKIQPKQLLHPEYQYLNAVRDIIASGTFIEDRTKIGIYAKFGLKFTFDLKESFPLLTTKRVFFKGVVEELLWMLRGDTSAEKLTKTGVHIWTANGSRSFLDSLGLVDRAEGDLGPVYGFQWRHFNGTYVDCETPCTNGVDQIANIISQIKNSPESRRIILCAWNPAQQHLMALPPCHVLAQFFVNIEKQTLSCLLYQRSADMGLGIPFNIASYALLTLILAQHCNLTAGEFIHAVGNAHVYTNHVDALKEQIIRSPRPFPTLAIKPFETIEELTMDHMVLSNYFPRPKINMPMAV